MHIARVGERLPRLQIQFRISRSFRPRNLANLGSKIRFWIRRKEHTPILSRSGEENWVDLNLDSKRKLLRVFSFAFIVSFRRAD